MGMFCKGREGEYWESLLLTGLLRQVYSIKMGNSEIYLNAIVSSVCTFLWSIAQTN